MCTQTAVRRHTQRNRPHIFAVKFCFIRMSQCTRSEKVKQIKIFKQLQGRRNLSKMVIQHTLEKQQLTLF